MRRRGRLGTPITHVVSGTEGVASDGDEQARRDWLTTGVASPHWLMQTERFQGNTHHLKLTPCAYGSMDHMCARCITKVFLVLGWATEISSTASSQLMAPVCHVVYHLYGLHPRNVFWVCTILKRGGIVAHGGTIVHDTLDN